jgi:precorrin-2 dehydrogenase/sirohydrochlorin ferrochelatase
MRYFPVNLDLNGKPAVIVGGGTVATRKCRSLLDSGAAVTLISPYVTPELRRMIDSGTIRHIERSYHSGDLKGAYIAFIATSDSSINRCAAEEARTGGILANVADEPDMGTFTLPATCRRGDLVLTVSTGGGYPALSRHIRSQLETMYGPEYAPLLILLSRIREKLLTDKGNSAYNKRILNELLHHDLHVCIRKLATDDINRILLKLLGPEYTLAGLGLSEEDFS